MAAPLGDVGGALATAGALLCLSLCKGCNFEPLLKVILLGGACHAGA